jgi:predicted nucleotidyltransferase component of viral defense system
MAAELHEDRDLFRAALTYTAARTGFVARLVEKDYYCTLLLRHFAAQAPELVFKGGTCLAKVHVGFYRMSEDLDFVIPVELGSARSERSRRIANAKKVVQEIEGLAAGVGIESVLAGANSSTQYSAVVGYSSALGARPETVKLEIGLREPLLLPIDRAPARTLLLDPVSGGESMPAFEVPCIAALEGLAEKLRAALTRRVPAIRDFYDIDHALRGGRLQQSDAVLLGMLRAKLEVPGNPEVDISAERLAALRRQVDAELRPVLREPDFVAFDLERAFERLRSLAASVRSR